MPFGYGPAAKLVSLARRLQGDLRLVFAGEGSTYEFVSRTTGVFDAVVPGSPAGEAAAPWLREADAVISIMDRDAGAAAARAAKPLYVVDSLLWMRAEIPEALRGAHVYWAQRLSDLAEGDYTPRPCWVGPLVAPRRAAPRARSGLVVNLGGSRAPDDRAALFGAYARLALRALLAAELPARFGRVSVIGGEPAIAALAGETSNPRIECATLAPDDARECMAGAGALLTAPGLTTTLEACLDRTPTWFLPPQNYSQWCSLHRLRACGLAEGALHWEDLPGAPQLRERMPQPQHAPIVAPAILRACADAGVAARLAASLRSVGDGAPERVARQSAFFASLGPSGLDDVAAVLRRLASDAARRREAALVCEPTSSRSPAWTS
jgi:hypothetical protein